MHDAIYAPNPAQRARDHRDVCQLSGLKTIVVIKPDEATVYTFQDNEHGAITFSRTGNLGRYAERNTNARRHRSGRD